MAVRTDYPARTLTATYQSGLTHAIEVRPSKMKPITATDEGLMFEIEFSIAARAASDFVEAGF